MANGLIHNFTTNSTTMSPAMERHLKKIYECLNNGCNKKAVQEYDRLPKDMKDKTVFRALKSLAYIRMSKRRQAFEILNNIDVNDSLDEVTLQTMTSCYKESVDVRKIVELYEAAFERKPNDPEIMAHLFMAYVRVFNFKRQKEIALLMYKNLPTKRRLYSFWAIVSLVMQSQELKKSCLTQENPDRQVCLSLAEKMCEKIIDEERKMNQEPTNEEIELYLNILKKQGKHEKEYHFLTGPICSRLTDHLSWFNRRRAYLCLDLRMYSRAFKHYFPTLIQEYPDQIEYYQGLFKAAYLLDTEAPSQQQPVAMNTADQQSQTNSTGTPVKSTSSCLAECYDIVEKQCALTLETSDQPRNKNVQSLPRNLSRTSSLNPNRKGLLRGPFMARIELYHTIISNESNLPTNVYNLCLNQFANKYPTLNHLLLEYFQTFSKKIICYYDMNYMINLLNCNAGDKRDLVKIIGDWVVNLRDSQQESNQYNYYHIMLNYHMLKHSLHEYKLTDKIEDRLILTKQYINYYDENRHLGFGTNKTEFQPVDNYCLLAVNSIMTNSIDLAGQTILSDSIIVSLIVLCENAITNSPSNHQLKLTLLKLYSLVGASKQCQDVLVSLDIKHFQIDTLGHLLNPVLYNTGNYSISQVSLETCSEFYAFGVRECFEGLTSSYRDGRFSKIEEISSVLKRLCDSLNAIQCVLLKGIVTNLNASTPEELSTACQMFDPFKGLHRMFRSDFADIMRDSRDLKVIKSFNVETDELIKKRQLETMEDEQLWLKLRYYLIRSVYLQLKYLSHEQCYTEQEKQEHLSELQIGKEVVENLRPRIDEAASSNDDKRYSYFEPESSPFRWRHIDFQSLVSLVSPLVFLSNASELNREIQEGYSTHLDRIINDLEDQLTAISSLIEMKQALLSLTISVEFISLAITSLVSLAYMAQSSTTTSTNSGSSSRASSKSNAKTSASQQQQNAPVKLKSIPHQLINKTEAQLTKLSNLIKNVDPKALILDKVVNLEKNLSSDLNQHHSNEKLIPLMGQEVSS